MNLKTRKEFLNRHTARMSKQGRVLEEIIQHLLEELREEKLISAFRYNQPFSKDDMEGKDFTVTASGKEISFGVTISKQRLPNSRVRHQDVHQFCFPIGTNPDTMKRRIVELIQKQF